MIDVDAPGAYTPEDPDAILAELLGERKSELAEFMARPPDADVWALPRIYDAVMERAHRDGGQPTLPDRFMASIVSLGADRIGDLYAMTQVKIDDVGDRLYWSRTILKRALEIIMEARRKERGPDDHAPIAIPHAELTIENKVEFSPYEFDVDQIFEGLRGLPDDEIATLLRIEPERQEYVLPLDSGQVVAINLAVAYLRNPLRSYGPDAEACAVTLESLLSKRKVPGTMAVRNTATLLAWLRKNAGSERARIVAMGVRRNVTGSVTKIAPKTIMRRVDPIVPQPAIATTGGAA